MPLTGEQILEALRAVQDPDFHKDIVTLGFVKDLAIDGGKVSFSIELTTPACPFKEEMHAKAEAAVLAVSEVESVTIEMTARVRKADVSKEDLIPGVKHCIAIASGKGGVGKSTVSVNLAIALAQQGAKVGLMDGDVYGPSIPLMMGCDEKPFTNGDKIVPIERYRIKMMSLGFLLEEGQAVMWRGPMVAGTVKQLLADVDWGELDYLLVDLPPGTGDAPMTLAQQAPLTGVVVVTTPHHVAANIAGKSVELFRKLEAPILGVVENMAGYVCPNCGETSHIFAGLSGRELAERYDTPYLGSIPLDPKISEAGDRGMPALVAFPESIQAQHFREIAGELARQISIATVSV